MNRDDLIAALSISAPANLAADLVESFLVLRQDAATGTLGRAAPGKFVESVVQILQFLDSGKYDAQPDVDLILRGLESRPSTMDDGLRICAARIARSMYSLRSKRSIAHKGSVDPNSYDLRFLYHAGQWILAELIRTAARLPMEQAGRLVDMVQIPIANVVEEFGDRKIVLVDLPTKDELLVLLHSYYPATVSVDALVKSMQRRKPGTIRNVLRTMWNARLIEGTPKTGYKLTTRGFGEAASVVASHLA